MGVGRRSHATARSVSDAGCHAANHPGSPRGVECVGIPRLNDNLMLVLIGPLRAAGGPGQGGARGGGSWSRPVQRAVDFVSED